MQFEVCLMGKQVKKQVNINEVISSCDKGYERDCKRMSYFRRVSQGRPLSRCHLTWEMKSRNEPAGAKRERQARQRDFILCTEALRRDRAWCIHRPARSSWLEPGWGSMRVVVGEVCMSQSRQALIYHKESEFYSRYYRTSWGYKARMVDICYNFGT